MEQIIKIINVQYFPLVWPCVLEQFPESRPILISENGQPSHGLFYLVSLTTEVVRKGK